MRVYFLRDGLFIILNICVCSAGTGKSFVLKSIIDALPKDSTAVTAATGVAALNIGGLTVHSWAGIGTASKPAVQLASSVSKDLNASSRWKTCRTLIIDEISMVDGELFDKLELVARTVRKNDRPFGGIQIILCGDFLQLPPVNMNKFCFESAIFKACISQRILLHTVFRQKDEIFVNVFIFIFILFILFSFLMKLDAVKLNP